MQTLHTHSAQAMVNDLDADERFYECHAVLDVWHFLHELIYLVLVCVETD